MRLYPYTASMDAYLQQDEVIDFMNSNIIELAHRFDAATDSKSKYIQLVFAYVRDQISHSADVNLDEVTYRASDVLQKGHGICFAKSHLLAALLRCKSIPTGFCYQRLILDEAAPQLVLHGLNAVYVEEYQTWVRMDARGNPFDESTSLVLPKEHLAYTIRPEKKEEDIPMIFPKPDAHVLQALRGCTTRTQLMHQLPSVLAYEI